MMPAALKPGLVGTEYQGAEGRMIRYRGLHRPRYCLPTPRIHGKLVPYSLRQVARLNLALSNPNNR